MMSNNRITLGKTGEDQACKFLIANGYKIIERNFKAKFGEIDIIAKDKNCLCFIEVKTRTTQDFGSPFEAITKLKRSHLIKTALHYLNHKKLKYDALRFDIVSITPDSNIEVIKEAFGVE